MGKSTFFSGQPILNQILSLIPTSLINSASRQTNADYYYKHFKAFDHLVTMLFSSFHQCSSLRELHTSLLANGHKLKHLGIKHIPRRSTISDANRRRPAAFFEQLYHSLYKYHYPQHYPDSRSRQKISDRLFIVDSTTVSLFSTVMKGAGVKGLNGRKKGGIVKDWIVQLGNPQTDKTSPVQTARIISIYDKTTNKRIDLLTNNLTYEPSTIRRLYKKRWAIELLFKRIKQNSQLNNFLGENENAISIQLWGVLIKDLLIKVIKDTVQKQRDKKWSFSNLSGFLRLHLYTYIHLFKFLMDPEKALLQYNKGPTTVQIELFS